jgi:head-tail adaptor
MRAGAKNNPVTILYLDETIDPRYGTPNYSEVIWKTNVFAKIVHRRGKEVEVAGQITAETYVKFDFDYYDVDGINENMIIRHAGADYDIKAILRDDSLKNWIVVDAVTRPEPTERE